MSEGVTRLAAVHRNSVPHKPIFCSLVGIGLVVSAEKLPDMGFSFLVDKQ
tara:strand:+ start:6456 stop:6605 length:150 start_codon:yes stop_codon:yes gene_type:complete